MPSTEDSLPPSGSTLLRAFEALVVTFNERNIVMKLMAMRPQDESDIQDLLSAYAGKLDLDYVRAELDTFTEAEDPRRAKFEAWIQARCGG